MQCFGANIGRAPEVLAPAGNFESVVAAVRCGADAVYIGAKAFSARASAQNFDSDEIKRVAAFCHERGTGVHLALNTAVTDRELIEVAGIIEFAAKSGVDALIVSDPGVISLAKKICPSLPLHASTQMGVASLEGAEAVKKLGFDRAVLAREMSREEILKVTENCEIETEVFVHGALCMCVSGQCFMSSALGARSGNRGRCAQPCRLDFRLQGAHHVLSLRDLSLSGHISDIAAFGVTSLKIEGRMKSPEYVAAAVSLVRAGLDGGTERELVELAQDIFSRGGFTDGYFTSHIDSRMFGFRTEDEKIKSKQIALKIHELYRHELQRIPVSAELAVKVGKAVLSLKDREGNEGVASCCETVSSEWNMDAIRTKISKLGSTPYYLDTFEAICGKGVGISLSALTGMRENAAKMLSEKRSAVCEKPCFEPTFAEVKKRRGRTHKLYARFENAAQAMKSADLCDRALLPVRELDCLEKMPRELNGKVIAELDRWAFSNDGFTEEALKKLHGLNIDEVCVQNISQLFMAQRENFKVLWGPFMNTFNSEALRFLSQNGVSEAVASFELSSKRISELDVCIPVGALVYGYIPLMMTRVCPVKNIRSCKVCGSSGTFLTDRTGRRMRVTCRKAISEIYNNVPLVAKPDNPDFNGLDFLFVFFTCEAPERCRSILTDIKLKKTPECSEGFTRGLYLKGAI